MKSSYTALSVVCLITLALLAPQVASAQLTGAFGYQATGFGPQNGGTSRFITVTCSGNAVTAARNVRPDVPCPTLASPNPRSIGAGNTFVFAAAGLLVFDGAGHVAVTDSVSVNGSITRLETYTGTYFVNSNGAGSLTLHSGVSGVPVNYDFVIVNNGTQLNLVSTDQGVTLSGVAIKQ